MDIDIFILKLQNVYDLMAVVQSRAMDKFTEYIGKAGQLVKWVKRRREEYRNARLTIAQRLDLIDYNKMLNFLECSVDTCTWLVRKSKWKLERWMTENKLMFSVSYVPSTNTRRGGKQGRIGRCGGRKFRRCQPSRADIPPAYKLKRLDSVCTELLLIIAIGLQNCEDIDNFIKIVNEMCNNSN